MLFADAHRSGVERVDGTIARWRLWNQFLVAPHATSAGDVLGGLLAVQAENPSQLAWAVAARTVTPSATDLAERLTSGQILRTHVLRPTWHYVAAADLDWLLALTGPRNVRIFDSQLKDFGLGPRDLARLDGVVLDLLGDAPDRTRGEVTAALRDRVPHLAEGGIGRLTMLLLGRLEIDRRIVSGAPREGEHTYARYEGRLERADPDAFDRDAALARLTRRYFTGHGPATDRDLAYWATLPITDVRRGRESVAHELESFEHDGRTYWHAPGDPPDAQGEPRGHLLQLLDEMYRGYQDSRMVIDARSVVSRGREKAIGMALVDGQLVAAMKRVVGASAVRFELTPFAGLTAPQRTAVDEAADRYGAFLGLSATTTLV